MLVALCSVQIAKAAGYKTIGTCSTGKVDIVKNLGCDVVIDYSKEDVVAKVTEATGGAGVSAVLDGVGADTYEASLAVLGRRGICVFFGNASGIRDFGCGCVESCRFACSSVLGAMLHTRCNHVPPFPSFCCCSKCFDFDFACCCCVLPLHSYVHVVPPGTRPQARCRRSRRSR
jgi:hypothetical protein